MSDDASPLANFMGTVRLFPLPNAVLFPQVMQPLHVFEPRYRQLAEDALAGDRFIAMALLAPGWQSDPAGCPAICATPLTPSVSALLTDQPFGDAAGLQTKTLVDPTPYSLPRNGIQNWTFSPRVTPAALFVLAAKSERVNCPSRLPSRPFAVKYSA